MNLKSVLDEIKKLDIQTEKQKSDKLIKLTAKSIEAITPAQIEKTPELVSRLLEIAAEPHKMHLVASELDCDKFYDCGQILLESGCRDCILNYLEIFRSSNILRRIYDQNMWPELIDKLLEKSNYTVAELLRMRVKNYPEKVIFSVLEGEKQFDYTFSEITLRVRKIAQGLLALKKNSKDFKIAFLCENSLSMVLFDLACLSTGIVNIMIPANSVPSHIEYILKRTGSKVLVVTNENLLQKYKDIPTQPEELKTIIMCSGSAQQDKNIITAEQLIKAGESVTDEIFNKAVSKINYKDLASIMFTSGTTGNPKGIMFSQQNIIFKRFCRAMAIPEIGDQDRYLAYLPLFHTFGRWLEMMGAIFWNATYYFMENPSVETMLNNMQRVKPTIFISIPKKWYQLYEMVGKSVDIEHDSDEVIEFELKRLNGGKLKWGLSAAGHLDSDVFQFFQRNGVELMSGFGMTEATGGITMTPQGKYLPNSLGKALPGVEIKLAEDGELWIKGSYVMMGYFNPEESEHNMQDGWLPTGDIMETDQNGFIRIIDRKKEIYKNVKGETIAPQKIENYFKEFEFIKNVFLVGDHRPYNTILIYPNYENDQSRFEEMKDDELRGFFSSVVVSVNRFLAPYERIVDFRIIDRDFSMEKGELTPKSTYKRSVIEKNFADVVQPMYEKNYISVYDHDFEIRIPNWFLREKGLTSNEISFERGSVYLENSRWGLVIEKNKEAIRIGQFQYKINTPYLNLSKILVNPMLWLGNEALINFSGENIFRWHRREEPDESLVFDRVIVSYQPTPDLRDQLDRLYNKSENSLVGLHLTSMLIMSTNTEDAEVSISYLEKVAADSKSDLAPIALEILRRSSTISSPEFRRKAFCHLVNISPDEDFYQDLNNFLKADKNLIDQFVIEYISNQTISVPKLNDIFKITQLLAEKSDLVTMPLLSLLVSYGRSRPTRYKMIRQNLMIVQRIAGNTKITEAAKDSRMSLRNGFRDWLGKNQQVAVDIETGEEYTWEDVITFEEEIPEEDKQILQETIKRTACIREAVFLFSNNVQVRLDDIPPGGIWISFLGKEHGKTVYRVTVQTRYRGSYDLAINMNKALSHEQIVEETEWLILSGPMDREEKLVEEFGGYWNKYDLWSEEFIPGETVGKFFRRLTRQKSNTNLERLTLLWPYFIWSAAAAYFSFWKKTGYLMEITEPSPENVIIPDHDYQTGSRIVSISVRQEHSNILAMIKNYHSNFVEQMTEKYEFLDSNQKNCFYIFSAFLEVVGPELGMKELNNCLKDCKDNPKIKDALKSFIRGYKKEGFLPKRLYFAIRRYNRWMSLNQDATLQARAFMMGELFETYSLSGLEEKYPETRTLFFLKTVFASSGDELKNMIREIISEIRNSGVSSTRQVQLFSSLQKIPDLNEEERFFILRLTFPHLQPDDSAELVQLERGGKARTNLVVQVQDYDGNVFSIRSPISPKEIAKLHQLFLLNKLAVQFKPEHRYLIAVNERGTLVGGLFYKQLDKNMVHFEKVVVDEHFRKKGISDTLLNELFKRLKTRNIDFITTGFFRPEYFYRFGFKIERKYAGLVKDLKNIS